MQDLNHLFIHETNIRQQATTSQSTYQAKGLVSLKKRQLFIKCNVKLLPIIPKPFKYQWLLLMWNV